MESTESRIQQDIVKYFRNGFCLKHHNPRSIILSIPNSKNPLLRETGMMSGAADLLVVYNNGTWTDAMFVEIKTPQGKQSAKQVKFQEHIEQMGMTYVVVRSVEEFKCLIQSNG